MQLVISQEDFDAQSTIEIESKRTPEEALALTKEAKMGSWRDDWRPYCLKCDTFSRMERMPHGFDCLSCGSVIGHNLCRLQESSHNFKKSKYATEVPGRAVRTTSPTSNCLACGFPDNVISTLAGDMCVHCHKVVKVAL